MLQLKGYLSNNKDNLTRPHLLKKADSIVFVVDFVQNSDLSNPARNYMFKVSNRNTRTRYEICSKLTIKTPYWSQWRRSGVFIVNFEHISDHILVLLLFKKSNVNLVRELRYRVGNSEIEIFVPQYQSRRFLEDSKPPNL